MTDAPALVRGEAPSATGRPSAEDHLAIADALLRFAAGTDAGDAALLASAFAAEAVVDFGPCGYRLGLRFEPLGGKDAIVGFLAGTAMHQVTSHIVTNARAGMTDGRTTLRALVDATHIVRADPARRFRMMNRYAADLLPDRGEWRLSRLLIDNIWFEGDPRIMLTR